MFSNRKKPNIIVIVMDGARADAIEKISYFKEIKKQSVFFPNMITYAPYTLASLHAIFSGIYGNSNGVNGYYRGYDFDKENCFTLTQYLKDSGYYCVGDFMDKIVAPEQGFDVFQWHNEHEDNLSERHNKIIKSIKGKEPFFLFLHYTKIHASLVKKIRDKNSDFDMGYFRNKGKNLVDHIHLVEKGAAYLKRTIEKLKSAGLYENSIFLILSDHGNSCGDKFGESMHGCFLYDYTIRCFLYLMGENLPKNAEVSYVIRTIDILPTLMDILRIKEKNGYKKLQGKSFMQLVYGKKENRIAYSETGGLYGSTPSPKVHNVRSVRTNKWKLIFNKTTKIMELYDLEHDNEEKNNLAGKKPEIEDYLWKKMTNG